MERITKAKFVEEKFLFSSQKLKSIIAEVGIKDKKATEESHEFTTTVRCRFCKNHIAADPMLGPVSLDLLERDQEGSECIS